MDKNEKDIIHIHDDKYDVQEEWINRIASKYFDLDEINQNKIGLFGYLNEVMATEIKYNVAHRNFLLDEAFLNTASKRNSIYNKAKSYNYDIPLAKPSSFNMIFSIRDIDILEYGEEEVDEITGKRTGNIIFRIHRNSVFSLNVFKFMSEHDIVIKATRLSSREYSYTSYYDFSSNSDKNSYFDEYKKPYIRTWVDSSEGLRVISMYIKVYQMEKKETTFENYSSDVSDNLLFEVPFTDQLANFNVVYEHLGKKEYIKGHFNDTFTPNDERYYFYNISDGKLNIMFSSLPNGFKPAINSKIHVETFTTKGSAGNFNYDGNIDFKILGEKTQGYGVDYIPSSKIQYNIIKENNPIGGLDSPSLKDIKKELIYEFLTRENLVTEFDLNSFFKNIIKKEAINESEIKFIKKRDDILRRTYGVYLLLKDKAGLIIPTNTIDIEIPYDVNKNLFLPAGTDIVYNTQRYIPYDPIDMEDLTDDIININGNKYLEYREGLEDYYNGKIYDLGTYTLYNDQDMDLNTYDITYKLPFSLLYKNKPFQRILMIKDTINDDVTFNFNYINSYINYEFIMSPLNIMRDAISFTPEDGLIKDEITLSFTMDTTMPRSEIYNGETNEDYKKLLIRAVINNPTGRGETYFDFKLSDTRKMVYSKVLKTNNEYDEYNRLCIVNSVRDINTGDLVENFYMDSETSMDIYFLIETGGNNFSEFKTLSRMKDIKDYSLAIQMENNKKLEIFKILNQVSMPILSFLDNSAEIENREDLEVNGVICKNIPVVGSHYLQDHDIYKEFFRVYDIYHNLLVYNFSKLENNTGLDLKFYNSYGISKQFSSNNTHLELEFNIKLIDQFSKDLDYKIKKYIIDFIESVNATKNRTFAISNLIKGLEKTFSNDIDYIEYIEMNKSKDQKIEYIYPDMKELNQQQLINFIPEFLNVRINESSYSELTDSLDTGIKINYL